MQRVNVKHRKRQGDEQTAEQNNDPRFLKDRLSLLARCGEGRAGDRIRYGHAHHVGQRKQEGATRGNLGALTGNDSGQDWNHGQHAGREGEQQPQPVKGRQHEQQIAVTDEAGEAILL